MCAKSRRAKSNKTIYLVLTLIVLLTIIGEFLILLQSGNHPQYNHLPLQKQIIRFFTLSGDQTWGLIALFLFAIGAATVMMLVIRQHNIQRIREQLSLSERRLNEAFKVVNEGVFEWMSPSDDAYISESLFRLCGYDQPTQIIELANLLALIHPDEREYTQKQLQDAVANYNPLNFEIRLRHRDGHYFSVHVQGKPYSPDRACQLCSIIGTVRDLSSDQEAQKQLASLSNQLNSALRLTGESVFEIPVKTMILGANISPNDNIGGVSASELEGKHINKLLTVHDFEQLLHWLEIPDNAPGWENFRLEIMLKMNQNSSTPARLTFQKSRRGNDDILIMNVLDMSSGIEEAHLSSMLLKMTSDNLPLGLIITREDGSIHYYNQTAGGMMRHLNESGKIWKKLPIPGYSEESYRAHWNQMKTAGSLQLDINYESHNYEMNGYYLNVAPGFVCLLLIDQTKMVENELRLSRALSAEQLANQKRLHILSSTNYELRKPLTGILGFADLLQDEELSAEERQEYLKLIAESGNDLLKLWTSVLELSTLECGLMEVVPEKTNLNSILNQVKNTYETQMPPGVQFRMQKSLRDVDADIISDESLIGHIFAKLLDYSIKIPNSGGIDVGYIVSGNQAAFYVANTRNDISADELRKLLDPFGDKISTWNNTQETNRMPLLIARQMVELLQGRISLQDNVGGGCRICFEIPFQTVDGGKDSHETTT